jgi:hypothetical protein
MVITIMMKSVSVIIAVIRMIKLIIITRIMAVTIISMMILIQGLLCMLYIPSHEYFFLIDLVLMLFWLVPY